MRLPRKPRTLAILGAAIAVLVTVALGTIELRLRQNVVQSARWVTHTLEVQRQFDAVQLAMTEIEANKPASADTDSHVRELASLVSDNPGQSQRVAGLAALVDRASRGDDVVREIRASVRDGIAAEEMLLADREATLQRGIARRGFMVWGLIALDATVLAGLLWAMWRLQQLQPMVTVCAGTQTIEYENEWITFEEYLARRFHVRVSPGLSPDEADRIMATVRETQIFDRR